MQIAKILISKPRIEFSFSLTSFFVALSISILEPNYRVIENQVFQEVCVELTGETEEMIPVTLIARQSVPADAIGKYP